MKNFRQLFKIHKWVKIALIALSPLAVALLAVAFALQNWADSQTDSANLIFTKMDIHNSNDLSNKYAYEAKVHSMRFGFLLGDENVLRINAINIAWDSNIDSSAIVSYEAHNRILYFTSTQKLVLDSGANLGVMSYKMDFNPLKNDLLKYISFVYITIFFIMIALNFLYDKFQTNSPIMLLRILNARFNNISQIKLAQIQDICLRISFALLIFTTTLFVLSTLGFIAKIPINALYCCLAFGVALIALLYQNAHKIPSAIIFLGIFALSVILAINFYDASWDGRAYHQIGIYYLANGWNPVYEKMSAVTNLSQFLSHELWVECYLKFAEIAQSCIYKAFGLIESGKMINYIFACGAFLYGIATISKLKYINIAMAILLSLLATFSPVVVGQISTYYIDGLLGCALLVVFLVILNLENSAVESKKLHYAIFVIALLAMASIKLTGLAYAGFIGVAYFIYKIFCKDWRESKCVFICGVIATIFIILCNTNPLLTNLKDGRHIGYPLLGENKVDIITGNAPKNFAGLNRFEKLAHSLFSKTQNLLASSSQDSTQLKIPFIKNAGEESMGGTDMRVAGFGYFFGGIIILCALMILCNLCAFKDKRFALWFGLIFGSCVINPEMWWARYAPQMWLIPFIFVIFSYSFAPKIFSSKLRVAILGFLILSVALAMIHTSPSNYTQRINEKLANLDKQKILLYFPNGAEKSFAIKLMERGYKTQILSQDELEAQKARGVRFYKINADVLDNWDDKIALWNIAPK